MTKHDVECAVIEAKVIRITGFKGYVVYPPALCKVSCGGEDRLDGVDAHDGTGWDVPGQVNGDGAGAAAEVED